MNINQLKYFQAVCEFNNITKAAEKLHISQPSVSNAIKELEQDLGVSLLKRDKNKISLTPTGDFFLKRVTKLLDEMDRLFLDTRIFEEENKSFLRIGISDFGTPIYLKILPFISVYYSDRKLMIFEGTQEEVARRIDEGTLEFGIVPLDRGIMSKYHYKIVATSPVCYCVNRENPFASETAVSFLTVRKNPLVWFASEPILDRVLLEAYKRYDCKPNKRFTTKKMSVVSDFLRKDKVVGAFMMKEALEDQPEIVAIPIKESFKIQIGVIWKKDALMPVTGEFPEIVWSSYNRKIEKYLYKVIP